MSDDNKDDGTGTGFDDWLGDDAGPDTDPYAELKSDDGKEEIADWMAFTHGEDGDEPDVSDEPETVDEALLTAETEEIEAVATGVDEGGSDIAESDPPVSSDEAAEDVEGDTAEISLPGTNDEVGADDLEPATSVDFGEFDGGGRADTDEVPIVSEATVFAASSEEPAVSGDDDADLSDKAALDDTEFDTGELEQIDQDSDDPEQADDDTGELDPLDATPAAVAGASELFDLSQEDYLQTATKEHAGLAAAIAEADDEDTEQVALAAPIPGLEASVVGFDDVVEAEGHTKVRARRSGDLTARVITAVILIAAFAASLVWRPALVALAIGVFVIGAGEFYTALTRSGQKPIGLFGFLGIIAASLGAFFWGAIAIPTAFFLVVVFLLLYYAVVPDRQDPMGNLAWTITVMVWVGLGTYAILIAVSEYYRPLVMGVVVTVAAMDIAQYFVGRALGRHQLAPWVSPKKTVEGLVGGVIVALTLGALLHFVEPFELTSGLAIGVAVAVLVPLGDLAMSAVKRSLDIKDMGSVLPGHGGFLDRIDGLIFVVPAAWAVFVWAGVL
ncbi:MAG: phosphatidate cytidylyltransferase [Acidimicrobiia bacterium]